MILEKNYDVFSPGDITISGFNNPSVFNLSRLNKSRILVSG